MEDEPVQLVCISHLWWDWVWQRPQHLISRLAAHYPVLWAEEPRIEIGPTSEGFEVTEVKPNLRVAQLRFRSDAATFWERLDETLARSGAHAFKVPDTLREASLLFGSPAQEQLEHEIRDYVASRRRDPLILWLYTPVVVDFIDLLQPDLVVYDVMDELSTFKFASPRLKQQEQELMERADLVFTGGPSLYSARQGRHPSLHLFPSGVEQDHFAQALTDDLAVPEDIRNLSHPILGYFGVIDERLDLELIAAAAEAQPTWNWVLIGPVLKIAEQDLPRLPNIHYLGKQDYGQLPAYLKAFDVGLLPFARNDATRFISPTKTLEYMAAHKPIVSTSIQDVITLYGSVVKIADTPVEWVTQVRAALDETPEERAQRNSKEQALLRTLAWDHIAGEMHDLIANALKSKGGRR